MLQWERAGGVKISSKMPGLSGHVVTCPECFGKNHRINALLRNSMTDRCALACCPACRAAFTARMTEKEYLSDSGENFHPPNECPLIDRPRYDIRIKCIHCKIFIRSYLVGQQGRLLIVDDNQYATEEVGKEPADNRPVGYEEVLPYGCIPFEIGGRQKMLNATLPVLDGESVYRPCCGGLLPINAIGVEAHFMCEECYGGVTADDGSFTHVSDGCEGSGPYDLLNQCDDCGIMYRTGAMTRLIDGQFEATLAEGL